MEKSLSDLEQLDSGSGPYTLALSGRAYFFASAALHQGHNEAFGDVIASILPANGHVERLGLAPALQKYISIIASGS